MALGCTQAHRFLRRHGLRLHICVPGALEGSVWDWPEAYRPCSALFGAITTVARVIYKGEGEKLRDAAAGDGDVTAAVVVARCQCVCVCVNATSTLLNVPFPLLCALPLLHLASHLCSFMPLHTHLFLLLSAS